MACDAVTDRLNVLVDELLVQARRASGRAGLVHGDVDGELILPDELSDPHLLLQRAAGES
jgi:hypothetical protein